MENEQKKCQFCIKQIHEEATTCLHCGRDQISEDDVEYYTSQLAKAGGQVYFQAIEIGVQSFLGIMMGGAFLVAGLQFLGLLPETMKITNLWFIVAFIALLISIKSGSNAIKSNKIEIASTFKIPEIAATYKNYMKSLEAMKLRRVLYLLTSSFILIQSLHLLTITKPSVDDFREFYINSHPDLVDENPKFSRLNSNLIWSEFETKFANTDRREVYRGILGGFWLIESGDEK